jgi:hypothetical protein
VSGTADDPCSARYGPAQTLKFVGLHAGGP